MLRIITGIAFIVTCVEFGSCKKSVHSTAEILYGTWTKGTNFGDTLWFMEKNGRPIIRYASFNSGIPSYTENEYRFEDNSLSIKFGSDFRPLESFTWINEGRQFDILGYQLYLFMSSSVTHFAYTRIN